MDVGILLEAPGLCLFTFIPLYVIDTTPPFPCYHLYPLLLFSTPIITPFIGVRFSFDEKCRSTFRIEIMVLRETYVPIYPQFDVTYHMEYMLNGEKYLASQTKYDILNIYLSTVVL